MTHESFALIGSKLELFLCVVVFDAIIGWAKSSPLFRSLTCSISTYQLLGAYLATGDQFWRFCEFAGIKMHNLSNSTLLTVPPIFLHSYKQKFHILQYFYKIYSVLVPDYFYS